MPSRDSMTTPPSVTPLRPPSPPSVPGTPGLLDAGGAANLARQLDLARDAVVAGVEGATRPYAGAEVDDVRQVVEAVDLDRPLGCDDAAVGEAVAELQRVYLDHAVWFHHPRYQAHLNCPVAVPAVVADVVASAVNTSVDTWDQSGAATLMEQRLVAWVAGRIGFGPDAGGVFTSGGTQSNLHGLLLAREAAEAAGVPRDRWCVLVSEHAHFSSRRAAHLLGIRPEIRSGGRDDGVLEVACDAEGRMLPDALARSLQSARLRGLHPVAVVATAGTTDHGAVDPLADIAVLTRAHGAWLHVDAAYGGGLLVSPTRRGLLDGIERADSVTVDFHKTWFQPVACSALVVRDRALLDHARHHADYLNPDDVDGEAAPNLVDHSLQTTRRFDALKLWLTLRTLGADHVGVLVDQVCDLAAATRAALADDPDFDVVRGTDLSTVLMRYTRCPDHLADDVNDAARARLVTDGAASVARTRLGGRTWLKLTLLNPATTLDDTRHVVDLVRRLAADATDDLTLEAAR